jgi:hypothetical protein
MRFNLLKTDSKLLPAFTKPYEDEALGSWLTRMSFGHGLTRACMLKLIGMDYNPSQLREWAVDRIISDEQIKILSRYTNTSKTEIWNSTVRYYENTLCDTATTNRNTLGLWTVKRNRAVRSITSAPSTLYCPCCFSKPGVPVYYKRDWQLIVSFVCMDCQCYLKEQCPHCNMGPSRMNIIEYSGFMKSVDEYFVICHTCNKNISHCEPEPAPKHIIQLQKKINKYLRGNQIKYKSIEYFKALHKISCLLLKDEDNPFYPIATEIFSAYNIVDCRQQITPQQLSMLAVKSQADIFYLADELLKDWPNPFIGLANKYDLYEEKVLNYFTGMPEWFTTPLHDRLYASEPQMPLQDIYDPYLDYQRIKYHCNTTSDYYYNLNEHYYNGGLDIDMQLYEMKGEPKWRY